MCPTSFLEHWPPNSSDLNPIDYRPNSIWSELQENAYQCRIANVNEIETRLCLPVSVAQIDMDPSLPKSYTMALLSGSLLSGRIGFIFRISGKWVLPLVSLSFPPSHRPSLALSPLSLSD